MIAHAPANKPTFCSQNSSTKSCSNRRTTFGSKSSSVIRVVCVCLRESDRSIHQEMTTKVSVRQHYRHHRRIQRECIGRQCL